MHPEDRTPLDKLAAVHTPEAIQARLEGSPDQSYLRDFIYGGIDGAVTTFAVVGGVAGAQLSPAIVIVLGAANLVADGFSMAASNYLGTRAEIQERDQALAAENLHIDQIPDGEREEVRQIFASKGFKGHDLERAVEIITSNREHWLDLMLKEEFGISPVIRSPWRAALSTFLAFAGFGLIPLLPYIYPAMQGLAPEHGFAWSVAMTAAALFGVGALKSRFVQQHWTKAGAETLLIGGGAATLAYGVGLLLRGWVEAA